MEKLVSKAEHATNCKRDISRLSSMIGVYPVWLGHPESGIIPIMSIDPKAVSARIEQRLKVRGTNAASASRAIGASQDFIRDLGRAETINASASKVLALAQLLGCSVEWLLTGEGEDPDDSLSSEDVAHLVGDRGPNVGLPYGGTVQAGHFLPADLLDQSGHKHIPLPRDPRYPRARQYAYKVAGNSMDLAGIKDGMWVVAVDLGDFVEFHGELEDKMNAVVKRTRYSESEIELTVKQVRIFTDRVELRPVSSEDTHKPIIVPKENGDGAESVEIAAIVVWAGVIFDY